MFEDDEISDISIQDYNEGVVDDASEMMRLHNNLKGLSKQNSQLYSQSFKKNFSVKQPDYHEQIDLLQGIKRK